MSKEFQAYNRKYAKLAGTALKWIQSYSGYVPSTEDIHKIDGWFDRFKGHFTEAYDRHEIRYAVYGERGAAEKWQEFRVRLKGLNTKEKLYALRWWLDCIEAIEPNDWIRVNNYLGALKRSGHLDSNLKVAKL